MSVTARVDPSLDPLVVQLGDAISLPGQARYEHLVTPWNLAVRPTPAAVVGARTAQDVVDTVRTCAESGLAVAVQSSGHGIAGPLDGSVLISTQELLGCAVQPEGRATVQAGVHWQQLLDAAGAHGYGGLAGSTPHLSVVGYTTGGGLGPLARTYGFASDHVRSFDIVTGDGVLRHVTAEENPDLFWGVRGGKGALGIVTSMEMDLLPHPHLYAGALYFEGKHTEVVLRAWAEWCEDLPEGGTSSLAMLRLPDMPGVPPMLAGRPTVAVRFVWTGDPAEGARLLEPLRAAAPVLLDGVEVRPFADLGAVHADPVDPLPAHEASELLRELPSAAMDTLLSLAGPDAASPQLLVELRQLGGAVARDPLVPSAVCHRDASFVLNVIGVSVPPIAEILPVHARQVFAAMSPWSTGHTLPNFAPSEGPGRASASYDEATLTRLVQIAE